MKVIEPANRFFQDVRGVVVTIELILVAVVLGIGLMTWMSSMRDAVSSELSDLGGMVQDVNQSYVVLGASGASASTAGMDYLDQTDHCDDPDDIAGQADNCMRFDAPPTNENVGVSRDGLVVELAFDGDANDSASDNDATLLNGASIVNGELVFDGVDDFATIENSDEINTELHEERTIHIEFTPNDVTTRQVIYEEGGGVRGLNIFIENGMLFIGGYNIPETGWNPTFISTPITAGQPLSATLVLDGGSGLQPNAFSGFLNGSLIGRDVGSELFPHGGGIGIGGVNGDTVLNSGVTTAGSFFNGSISGIQIYNRALSDAEVGSL